MAKHGETETHVFFSWKTRKKVFRGEKSLMNFPNYIRTHIFFKLKDNANLDLKYLWDLYCKYCKLVFFVFWLCWRMQDVHKESLHLQGEVGESSLNTVDPPIFSGLRGRFWVSWVPKQSSNMWLVAGEMIQFDLRIISSNWVLIKVAN